MLGFLGREDAEFALSLCCETNRLFPVHDLSRFVFDSQNRLRLLLDTFSEPGVL